MISNLMTLLIGIAAFLTMARLHRFFMFLAVPFYSGCVHGARF